MPADCHRKHHETGLWFQIQSLEEIIATKEKKGEDVSFEKSLLRSWRKHQNTLNTSGMSKSSGIGG